MERWAANTLRTLGIVFTALIVICGCLLLVLLGQCAAQGGRNPGAGAEYFFGAGVLGIAGVMFIATLARGIYRSRLSPQDVTPVPESSAASSIPAEGERAVDRLFWCLVAQIGLIVLGYVYSWIQYQRMMPQIRSYYSAASLISSIVYVIPYVVLAGAVRQRLSRMVLAFAFGVPAAAILQTVATILPTMRFYLQNSYSLGTIIVPLILDIVLVVLAYQAAHGTVLEPPVSSLVTTVVVAFVYFYVLRLVLPFVYRLFMRH